ncbi:MAG: response regulator [Planctomycetes bacterium]|nr:response regulator [Planctomycetota bacterium]
MARRGNAAWPPGPDREVFTTGEVARLCNVTIRTVIRWVDSGALKGYRIPGSRDRRVPRSNLIEFMTAHQVPLGSLERKRGRRRILIVDDDPPIVEILESFFRQLPLFEVATAANGYEAGAKTVSFRPDLLLIDYSLGDITGVEVAKTVRANPALAQTKILCMSGYLDDDQIEEVLEQGIDDFIKKPLDLQDVHQRVLRLLGLL